MADLQPTERETTVQSLEEAVSLTASIPDTARRRACAFYMRVSTRNHGQNNRHASGRTRGIR
jgi:hypothetical protein